MVTAAVLHDLLKGKRQGKGARETERKRILDKVIEGRAGAGVWYEHECQIYADRQKGGGSDKGGGE